MANLTESAKDPAQTLKHAIAQSESNRREQRRQFNFDQLGQGRFHILLNEECIVDTIDYLVHREDGDREMQRKLLIALGEATLSDELRIRERALMVLSQAGERAYIRDDNASIILVMDNLCHWLRSESAMPAGMVVVLKRIEELAGWLFERSLWIEAEKVVAVLFEIAEGQLEKSVALKSLASQTMQRLASDSVLEKVCDAYLFEDDQQPLYKKLLLSFGTRAIIFMLQRVERSLSKNERMALLQLLPEYGSVVIGVATRYTENALPWTMLRNILYMVGEFGDDDGYPLIQRFLGNEDLRVQYEALSSLVKIGGNNLNQRLVQALATVNDSLKPHVLQVLCEHGGKDVNILKAVLELLDKRRQFSQESKERILCGAIAVLKVYPDPSSVEMLRRLQAEQGRLAGDVRLQLEEALRSLSPQLRHKARQVKKQDDISFDDDPQSRQKAMVQLKSMEEKLRAMLGKGDVEGASRYLSEQAVTEIRERNFVLAEKLRDRLLQINPMALDAVVALGEDIERAKNRQSADPNHDLWRELLGPLKSPERKAFLSLMHAEIVGKGQTVVSAGEFDNVLYFLESGQITLHCHAGGGNESFLKRIGPGAILGIEQFFSPSVWTITLKAASDVQLQVIDGAEFAELTETYLSLEQTLRTYCQGVTNIPELLKMSGDERRDFPRFAVPLWTRNTLIDPFGNKGKRSFRGELLDISRSGLSFMIKISSRNSGKLLLGRRVQCDIEERDNLVMAKCVGGIVGVRYRDNSTNDATVHIKLAEKFDEGVFAKILSLR